MEERHFFVLKPNASETFDIGVLKPRMERALASFYFVKSGIEDKVSYYVMEKLMLWAKTSFWSMFFPLHCPVLSLNDGRVHEEVRHGVRRSGATSLTLNLGFASSQRVTLGKLLNFQSLSFLICKKGMVMILSSNGCWSSKTSCNILLCKYYIFRES